MHIIEAIHATHLAYTTSCHEAGHGALRDAISLSEELAHPY
jgi:hypothetical protein